MRILKQPAVFLDKDGTLIENIPFNRDHSKIRLLDGVGEGLRQLSHLGYRLIVISNQSGIAQGLLTQEDVKNGFEALFEKLLLDHGVVMTAYYFCPHHPEGKNRQYVSLCKCRKPAEGLVLKSSEEWHIDLQNSWFIGDILDDVECGNRAGCRTVFLHNGNETEWKFSGQRIPDFVAEDFLTAAQIILRSYRGEEQEARAVLP